MTNNLNKKVISSDKAPKAIGPYSIGIVAGNFIFTSGQLGLDPDTGVLVGGSLEEETKQALMNLTEVLKAAGSSITNVVKTTVYLRDMNDFSRMNEVYSKFFTENPPARTAIQAAALPKGAGVEIEAIAILPPNNL